MTNNNMKKQEGKEDSITHIPFEITSESIRQYTSKPVSVKNKKLIKEVIDQFAPTLLALGWELTPEQAKAFFKVIDQQTAKARIEEHKIILDTYDEWYQKLSAEHGVQQATPHTAFHQISEERLKELEQQERQNNE